MLQTNYHMKIFPSAKKILHWATYNNLTAMNQTTNTQETTKWSQFGTLITVFFFWGFVAASNDILIPVFKEKLHASGKNSLKSWLHTGRH